MSGAGRITTERQRQIEAEGWDADHDDGYLDHELIRAAMSYLKVVHYPDRFTEARPSNWPWASAWWKPSDDPIRNLEKAGALIAAEIDRLERTS